MKKKAADTKAGEKKAFIIGLRGREILLFLVVFMFVSALFLGAWYYLGPYYQTVVFLFARPFLRLMGYTPLQIAALNLSTAYLGNFNLVPLIALAIATPRLALRSRLELLGLGIPLLFLLHVIDLVAHFPLYFHGSILAQVVVYSIGVGGVALPFIIWFFIWSTGSTLPEDERIS
jgi:hypothetical protein